VPAAGTFYAFCDVSGAISNLGLAGDNEFAELLLDKAGVAGVPGTGFGAPGHIRFSFAVSMPTLEKALERMGKVLA
jgi:aspartate aminotransferase